MIDYRFVWQSYSVFHSATNIQHFLHRCYNQKEIENADQKSYENSYPFIYYLEHGQNYYQLADNAPLSIKPVLLFYGMVQLIKAYLLTVDPKYPETTSVLAHGVSTRKRKKQGYEFLNDEVKVQKHGLFTHFSEKMFHVKQLEGEKYTMEMLLRRIPELNDVMTFTFQKHVSLKVYDQTSHTLNIPHTILDSLHMSENRFFDFFNEVMSVPVEHLDSSNNKFAFKLSQGELNPLYCSPLLFHLYENTFYLPTRREDYHFLPEMMVHYLLLYNLSMISRYETEWWSELLHSYSSLDYPFIQQFLSITSVKIPYLILLMLLEKNSEGGSFNGNLST